MDSDTFYSLRKTQIHISQAGIKLLMGRTKSLLEKSNTDMEDPQTTTAVSTDPYGVVQEKYAQITEAATLNPCVFLAKPECPLGPLSSPCQAGPCPMVGTPGLASSSNQKHLPGQRWCLGISQTV